MLSAETVLTFTITLATKLYNTNSYIKLEIARQQAVFQSTESSLIAADIQTSLQLKRVDSTSSTTALSYSVSAITTDYISISFQEPSCSCDAQKVLVYTLSNGAGSQKVTLRNPPDAALATNSIKVFTYDDKEYGVDSKESDIRIQPPLSSGALTLNSISTSSRKVFSVAKVTISVKTQTKLLASQSNNQIVVQLPQYLYYPPDQSNTFTPTCFISSQQLASCTSILKHENDDSSLP